MKIKVIDISLPPQHIETVTDDLFKLKDYIIIGEVDYDPQFDCDWA